MKLLHTRTLEISEFFDRRIPPYAILSHTWVQDEEMSYQEMINREGTGKSGYRKIKHCCSQAWKDGLEWAWIDTCSIDKSSSAELSEAINSMFRYYAQAAICYAYLADVDDSDLTTVAAQFRLSRWFTRGWTLQELLAPSKLIFLSSSWAQLGDRSTWQDDIADITSIHFSALSQEFRDFTRFSIAQRFSWMASRTTSREEDMAYCLLGIFGVHMPLLYGEGTNAFIRLQQEIMKSSDDQTIFAWEDSDANAYKHFLSPSPDLFRNSKMAALASRAHSHPFSMTNAGLQIAAILVYNPSRWGDVHVLCLPVLDERTPDLMVGLPLKQLTSNGDQFVRSSGLLISFPSLELQQMKNIRSELIYIRTDTTSPSVMVDNIQRRHEFRVTIPKNHQVQIQVEECYPAQQVHVRTSGRIGVTPPEKKGIASYLDGGSWHVAILLSFHISWNDEDGLPAADTAHVPSLGFSETYQCVLFIGYNGRTNLPLCIMSDTSPVEGIGLAQSSWIQFPEIAREAASRLFVWRKYSGDGVVEPVASGVEIVASVQDTIRQGLSLHDAVGHELKGLYNDITLRTGTRLSRVSLDTRFVTHVEDELASIAFE